LGLAALAVATLVGILARRFRRQNSHLAAALNNMSEGLCMFDGDARLVLCNDRYVEMYLLDPAQTKTGAQLRDLLQQRKRAGTFGGDPDLYIADTLRRMRA